MALKYKTLSQIQKVINGHLTHQRSFISKELVRENPPKWTCKNKKLVYEMVTPKGADSFHGKLEYTRWEEFPLPGTFKREEESELNELEIEVRNDVFDYSPP